MEEILDIETFLKNLKEIRDTSPLFEMKYSNGIETYYSIDVRRPDDSFDEEALIAKYPKEIRDKADCNLIELEYERFLEDERNYASEMCMSGGLLISSNKPFWDEILEMIRNGEVIGYPTIDNEHTLSMKIQRCNEMRIQDEEILCNFSVVKDCHFAGRSGGHFCIEVFEDPEEILEELIDDIKYDIQYSHKYNIHRSFDEYRDEFMDRLNHIEEVISQITYVFDFFTKMKNDMNWERRLKETLDDMTKIMETTD